MEIFDLFDRFGICTGADLKDILASSGHSSSGIYTCRRLALDVTMAHRRIGAASLLGVPD
jgi:hypothetical protein